MNRKLRRVGPALIFVAIVIGNWFGGSWATFGIAGLIVLGGLLTVIRIERARRVIRGLAAPAAEPAMAGTTDLKELSKKVGLSD